MEKELTSVNVNWNINVNEILKALFGSDHDNDRNDLAIIIQNGTHYKWDVGWNNDYGHGNYVNKVGDNPIKKINTTEDDPKPDRFELGFAAAGAGCNAIVTIKLNGSKSHYFAVMAATPSNKENYVRATYYSEDHSWETLNKYLEKRHDKHYSDQGPMDVTYDDVIARIDITNDPGEPGTCTIELRHK